MRAMVLALALLAGIKVWAQDRVFRSAAEEALITAYRDRAVQACQKAPQTDTRGYAPARFPVNWIHSTGARLVIGDDRLSVYIWDRDNELWNARYMSPFLVLSSASGLTCTYDIGVGTARVARASESEIF